MSNFCVLGNFCNWLQLLFLKALYIKNLAPKVNNSYESIRDLGLFRYSGDRLKMTFVLIVVLVQLLFCENRTSEPVDHCFVNV